MVITDVDNQGSRIPLSGQGLREELMYGRDKGIELDVPYVVFQLPGVKL